MGKYRHLIWVSLASLLCLGCDGTRSGASADTPYNVLIVTFDTTRADYLDLYGGPAPTPVLNALAEDGIVFEYAYASVPITLPSHTTLLTGKYPFAHGVRDNGLFVVGDEQVTLAEVLKEEDYATGAAIGSFPLVERFGLAQGFDFYDDHLTAAFEDFFGERIIPKERLFFDERKAGAVNSSLLPWIEDHADGPFLAWAHYFDPHFPHEPPPPYSHQYAHDRYAGEIGYSDASLGVIIQTLKDKGVYDNTIIVVTSDHGEGMGEHEESTHSLLAYNSTLHVPLIIKPPAGGRTGVREQARVGIIDVFPTILEWLGVAPPDDIHGESMAPFLWQDSVVDLENRSLYAETLSPRLSHGWGELRALFSGRFKYIHGPRPELFDLTDDPRELRNLAESNATRAASMRNALAQHLADNEVAGLDAAKPIDDDTARRLMGLGYISHAGVTAEPIKEKLREDGDPPQDRASVVSMYSQAKTFLFEGEYAKAQIFLDRLIRLDPDNGHYLELYARSEAYLGQYETALETLNRIPDDSVIPAREEVLEFKGSLQLASGREDLALTHYRDAQALRRTASGQYLLSELYRRRGDPSIQQRHLSNALELDATFLPAQLGLAIAKSINGETEEAERIFDSALREHPYFPRSHYNYGVFLLQAYADGDKALGHFNRAVELQPGYLQARYAVVETLATLGQSDDAFDAYLEMAAIAPASTLTDQAAQIVGATF